MDPPPTLEYASTGLARGGERLRQALGLFCLLMASPISAWLALEICYRLWLFWFTYDAVPGLNHVDAGYFRMVYTGVGTALMLSFVGAGLLRGRVWRLIAIVPGAVSLAVGAGSWYMHKTLMLVTYDEYAHLYGP